MQQGERMRAENGELRLPHTCVNIRITKPVEIYPELSPVVGQIYPAERYSPPSPMHLNSVTLRHSSEKIGEVTKPEPAPVIITLSISPRDSPFSEVKRPNAP